MNYTVCYRPRSRFTDTIFKFQYSKIQWNLSICIHIALCSIKSNDKMNQFAMLQFKHKAIMRNKKEF